jgi:hypothetical protein
LIERKDSPLSAPETIKECEETEADDFEKRGKTIEESEISYARVSLHSRSGLFGTAQLMYFNPKIG